MNAVHENVGGNVRLRVPSSVAVRDRCGKFASLGPAPRRVAMYRDHTGGALAERNSVPDVPYTCLNISLVLIMATSNDIGAGGCGLERNQWTGEEP